MKNNYSPLNRKLGALLVMLLAFCLSFTNSAHAADPPAPEMVVTGGGGNLVLAINQSQNVSLDAIVNHPPTTTSECTIDGPDWTWTATYTGTSSGTLAASGDANGIVVASFANPGTYNVSVTVKASYSSSCSAGKIDVLGGASFNVRVVKVDKIQYLQGTTWTDVPSQFYVLKGTSVSFKAVPTPAGAWPSSKPIWGGSASGTGETTSVTFNTTSPSSFSPSTVTATCGNTVSINVVVYEIKPKVTPIDDFPSRSKTRLGIGEFAVLSFDTLPATAAYYAKQETYIWTRSGSGYIEDIGDGTAAYIAGPENSSVTFTLSVDSGLSSGRQFTISQTIVEPDATTYMRPQYTIAHDNGTWSVGFVGEIYLCPKDVSFNQIKFAEGAGTSTATDWLQPDFDNLIHQPTGGYLGGLWLSVGGGNINDGSKVIIPFTPSGDIVGIGSYPRIPPTAPFGDGTMTWPIDWWYHYTHPTPPGGSTDKKFMVGTFHATSDATGKAVITKAGSAAISAESSDPTIAPDGWPGFPYPPAR